jgi:hypothetical protein
VLDFANGTSQTFENFAKVLIPFDGITDGKSLYDLWFTGNQPTETEDPAPSNSTAPTPSATASASATPIPAPGYPPPVVREIHNLIGGYFLEDEYSDVAVLSVPSFVGIDAQEQFQDTAVKFIAAAKAAGKKKLVVDVQANGGGTILLGYDLYSILFPNDIDHAAADRFRAFESTDIIGEQFSKAAEGLPRDPVTEQQNETLYQLQSDVISSTFNYRTDLNLQEKPFASWKQKFGPLHIKNDNFTELFRWNLDDPLITQNSGGIYVHGHGPLSNYTQQPFAAEDIVVITDGYCASTCTIFSELMRQRAGVKYISLGGRPREGITQAVGGVKGTNNLPWTYIQALAQYAVLNTTSSAEEAAQLNNTELGEYWSNVPFDRLAIGSSININFRDGIRDGDKTNIPLQFVYEPADCRILYTKQMTVDVTAIWKAAADSTWGGKSHCAAGHLGNNSTHGLARRELSSREEALSRRVKQWRRELKSDDYPLDVRTDLRKAKIMGDGIMWP